MNIAEIKHKLDKPMLRIVELQELYYQAEKQGYKSIERIILNRIFQ